MKLPIPSLSLVSGQKRPMFEILDDSDACTRQHVMWRMQSKFDFHVLIDGVVRPARSEEEFVQWFINPDNRQVDRTHIGSYMVSTVFMGTQPLFETMVFGPDPKACRGWRVATLENAKKSHALAIRFVEEEILKECGS